MNTVRKGLGWLWRIVTIILGLGILVVVLYPQALGWVGVALSKREAAVLTWAIIVTGGWFILGHNKIAWAVAEFEKSTPFALVVVGVVLAFVWQGQILVQILQKAGFGMTNILIMMAGFVAIIGGIVWKTSWKRS